jgi:ribonuclease HI
VTSTKRFTIYSDGAATPNPGPSGIGVVLYNEKGGVVAEISRYLGNSTNNKAEFLALIAGLEEALRLGAVAVDLKIDSELLVRQLQGTYRSKKMRQQYEQIRRLLGEFESYSIEHIPRERNKQADALSKKAIRRAGV